ncbi:MAG: hypothetical protein ACJAT0_002412 [Nonlabens sp.]|jgi:hypothetical protein|uniref:hypothetical protein n=1 Tax=Nonlabens sp. TaxID=1888209 RepID=UPI0039E6EC0C
MKLTPRKINIPHVITWAFYLTLLLKAIVSQLMKLDITGVTSLGAFVLGLIALIIVL